MRLITDDQTKMLGMRHLVKIGTILPARPIDAEMMMRVFELADQFLKPGIGFELDHRQCKNRPATGGYGFRIAGRVSGVNNARSVSGYSVTSSSSERSSLSEISAIKEGVKR